MNKIIDIKKKQLKKSSTKSLNSKPLKKNLTKSLNLELLKKNKNLYQIKNKRALDLKNRLEFLDKKLFFYNFHELLIKKAFRSKIVFRVKSNNFFCTFLRFNVNSNKERILQADSAGKYKLKTSKKKIKFNLPIVLHTFIKRLRKNRHIVMNKKRQVLNVFMLKVIAKARIRKKIVRKFGNFFKRFSLFYLQPKKCFNGCRASKCRRKKRLRFRVFK